MSESPGSGQAAAAAAASSAERDRDRAETATSESDGTAHSDAQSTGDPMEITPSASSQGKMGPPQSTSHDDLAAKAAATGVNTSGESQPASSNKDGGGSSAGNGNGPNAAAATSSQTPKVVQTAFIHKLYSMLEDSSISNLISWSANNESFVMSPSADFAKVLSQYFKHTNVSSFVRQLNMYGFHKVSDVFHTGSPDSALWEFKHGNGNFKRGDLASLREIKRRASRHTLIHRDSCSAPNSHKPSVSQAVPAAVEHAMEPHDVRLANLEHNLFEMYNRLLRMEEGNHALVLKFHSLNESLVKAHQHSLDLTHMMAGLVADPEHPARQDASRLEKEISRQLDTVRSYEDPHESLLSGRQNVFSNMALQEPVSPRAAAAGDERRASLHAIPPRHSTIRAAHQPNTAPTSALPQRRYGSIGAGYPLHSSAHRPPHAQMQITAHNPQHPLANVSEPGVNIGRRHTSADIRGHPWTASNPQTSPVASGQSSAQFPSSPTQPHPHPPAPFASVAAGDHQNVRDQLASFEFGKPRNSISMTQETPPLTTASTDTTPSTLSVESAWSLGTANSSAMQQHHHLPSFSFGANKAANPAAPPAAAAPPPVAVAVAAGQPQPQPRIVSGLPGSSSTSSLPQPQHSLSATQAHPPPITLQPSALQSSSAQQQQQQDAAQSSAPPTRRSSMASNVHSLLNPAETRGRDDDDAQHPPHHDNAGAQHAPSQGAMQGLAGAAGGGLAAGGGGLAGGMAVEHKMHHPTSPRSHAYTHAQGYAAVGVGGEYTGEERKRKRLMVN